MTVPGLLAQSARRWPDRPFLSSTAPSGERAVATYYEVYRRAGALASLLAANSVRPGSRVAVVLPNCFELVYLWFGVTALGATLVPLDPRLTDPELTMLMKHADPALVVLPADRHCPVAIPAIRAGGPELAATTAEREPPPLPMPASPATLAAVLYTSGSTGEPKGCMLTHQSFVLPAIHMTDRLGLTPQDVALHVLPLHHMAGLSFLTTALAAGAGVELAARFSGTRFWQQASASGATVFRHLGEMLAMLCARPPTAAERGHQLRLAYGGGASPAAAAAFTARFGVPTVEGYGLSETNTVLCGTLDQPRTGTIGLPLPHVQVRLMSSAGEVTGAGTGELQVKPNPALMLGYFGAPGLTAEAFEGGWYRTGDLVSRDLDGEFRFVRRITDVIRRRGENIDPTEIERTAEALDGVHRAAAVEVPADPAGVEIKLYVEPQSGHSLSVEDVLAHCAERLAPFKLPRYVEIIDRLPLTATQKVDRRALRRLDLISAGRQQ